MPSLERYQRKLDYSYAPGLFPTMEALLKRPETVRRVLVAEKAAGEGIEKLRALCAEKAIRMETADRVLRNLSGKENCFAAAVVRKENRPLTGDRHVVLHHISDHGNLGTIMRTALGLGIRDLAVIRPAADMWDPHVIRASMGAAFSLNLREYPDFDAYLEDCGDRPLYPFMLTSSVSLEEGSMRAGNRFALIFGNEGTGLPEAFAALGQPVRIPQTADVDSLNLSIAAAIGMYAFTRAVEQKARRKGENTDGE